MTSDELLRNYSGNRAKTYDKRRKSTRRWRAEVAAMSNLLDIVDAKTVLDCPFGTGRWIDEYVQRDMQVYGVDLSGEMLDEAREKLTLLDRPDRISLEKQSIFDLDPTARPTPDLVVCIRFLNWIDWNQSCEALRKLDEQGAKSCILGASVVPVDAGRIRRKLYEFQLARINRKRGDRPPQYVHDEAELYEFTTSLGWSLRAKKQIMRRHGRVNYFYLFEKQTRSAGD